MSWDKTMQARAVAEGWQLADTVDSGSKFPYLMVAVADSRFKNALQAIEHVVARARSGSALHQHALHVAATSRLRPAPPTRTKR